MLDLFEYDEDSYPLLQLVTIDRVMNDVSLKKAQYMLACANDAFGRGMRYTHLSYDGKYVAAKLHAPMHIGDVIAAHPLAVSEEIPRSEAHVRIAVYTRPSADAITFAYGSSALAATETSTGIGIRYIFDHIIVPHVFMRPAWADNFGIYTLAQDEVLSSGSTVLMVCCDQPAHLPVSTPLGRFMIHSTYLPVNSLYLHSVKDDVYIIVRTLMDYTYGDIKHTLAHMLTLVLGVPVDHKSIALYASLTEPFMCHSECRLAVISESGHVYRHTACGLVDPVRYASVYPISNVALFIEPLSDDMVFSTNSIFLMDISGISRVVTGRVVTSRVVT